MPTGQQTTSSANQSDYRPSISEEGSSESSYWFKITGLENTIKSVLEFKVSARQTTFCTG